MKIKQLIIGALCIVSGLILFSAFHQNDTTNKFLTMRVIECNNLGWSSKIIITDENGIVTESEISKASASGLSENTKHINEMLNKIASKNYALISSAGNGGDAAHVTNYTFIKK